MLIKIIGFALVSCILFSLLDTYSPQIKPAFLLAVAALSLFLLVPSLQQVIKEISNLFHLSEILALPGRVLVKCMLICFLANTAKEVCMDCGQKLIASQVETAGKITVIMLNIPLLISIVDQIYSMIQL